MKWILIMVLSTIFVCNTTAQKHMMLKINEIESQIHIASKESHKIYIIAPDKQNLLKSALSPKANIIVKYINFPDEAKHAFEYAVSIWESLISSPVPIRIIAEWGSLLNINIMESARPNAFYSSCDENTIPDVLYPVALLEKILGKEVNNEEPDIYCSFKKNISWYFVTDGNTPVKRYDFTTAVLHEITHGLGFAGFLKNIEGQGIINNPANLSSIYDYYLVNAAKLQITDKSIFPDSSEELGKQITSDEVMFFRSDNKFGDENTNDNVYAPKIWKDGASIFHLNQSATNEDRLMTAYAKKGEAIHNPVLSYHSDFDSENTDFVSNDFIVSRQPGFYSGILQTCHPYPLSSFENEKYNLIAQLRSPIILQKNGKMSYSEVVLVEPGLPATASTGPFFWDFVVVEGSKNNGTTWHPFKNEYDSQLEDTWQKLFNNSIANGSSYGVPEESMLAEHEIALTENEFFAAGDTVLIRFRLASDQTINGWGWAIDNLNIQYLSTANNELTALENYNIYPNPFSETINIERISASNFSDVNIIITDIISRTVFSETWVNHSSVNKKQLNLPNLKSGIYMLSLIENNSTRITKRIIKK